MKCVFITENEEAALLDNFLRRSGLAHQDVDAPTQRYVQASWRYGQWLKAEAGRYGLAVVGPRPYEGLVGRLLDII